MIATLRFVTANSPARNSQMAAFALPFSGAAVILILREPSGSRPTTSFFELFGITFNVSSNLPFVRRSAQK